MTKILKSAVLNTVGAAGANLADDATAEQYVLCTDNTADPLVPIGLPPIPYGSYYDSESEAAVLEVPQIVMIGEDNETIVASRRYKVEIGAYADKYETTTVGLNPYAYTAPAILSGNANTDRYNVYYALVTKINNYAGNNVEAFLCTKVTFAAGELTTTSGVTATTAVGPVAAVTTTNKVRAGEAGVQGSGATCRIAAVTGTGANIGAYAGYLWVYDIDETAGAWDSTNAITFTDSVNTEVLICTAATAAGADIEGQGMVVVDDTGYFTTVSRYGFSTVMVTEGFGTAVAEVVCTPYYERGNGTTMLANALAYNYTGEDVTRDVLDHDYDFATNPVAGTYYTKVTIILHKPVDEQALGWPVSAKEVRMVLWLAQTSSAAQGANVTNLVAAIVAMT